MLATAVASRPLLLTLLRRVTRGKRLQPHPLATPIGSSLAFGAIFVSVWFLLSTVVFLVWFIVWRQTTGRMLGPYRISAAVRLVVSLPKVQLTDPRVIRSVDYLMRVSSEIALLASRCEPAFTPM
jgi:hypothetical protein